MEKSSLVLLSGGLDSMASFHWAHKNTHLKMALTLDYGQRAAKREAHSAELICKKYNVAHRLLTLNFFSPKGGALMDDGVPLPHLQGKELDDPLLTQDSASKVWVPNRNGVFLNVAACLAEEEQIDSVVVGFNKEEAATFPDNSMDFVKAANLFFSYSTKNKVRVLSPMGEKNKVEIMGYVLEEKVDLNLLWSCYEGGEKMCGRCESCGRLMRALKEGAPSWISQLF